MLPACPCSSAGICEQFVSNGSPNRIATMYANLIGAAEPHRRIWPLIDTAHWLRANHANLDTFRIGHVTNHNNSRSWWFTSAAAGPAA